MKGFWMTDYVYYFSTCCTYAFNTVALFYMQAYTYRWLSPSDTLHAHVHSNTQDSLNEDCQFLIAQLELFANLCKVVI